MANRNSKPRNFNPSAIPARPQESFGTNRNPNPPAAPARPQEGLATNPDPNPPVSMVAIGTVAAMAAAAAAGWHYGFSRDYDPQNRGSRGHGSQGHGSRAGQISAEDQLDALIKPTQAWLSWTSGQHRYAQRFPTYNLASAHEKERLKDSNHYKRVNTSKVPRRAASPRGSRSPLRSGSCPVDYSRETCRSERCSGGGPLW